MGVYGGVQRTSFLSSMASLKKHSTSPFWYLKYKSPDGAWREKSTGFRHGIGTETKKANALCAKHTMEENERGPARQHWDGWVPAFLELKYPPGKAVSSRVRAAWSAVRRFLTEKAIHTPGQLTREHCMAYMPWRKAQKVGEHLVAHNTARMELVYLGVVCEEAVNRQMIPRNPAHRLGIGKERGKVKPALTDQLIEQIRKALEVEPAWMSHAFEIAIHQGCRISETQIFTGAVDFARGCIHFRKTKGDKPFTAPMHPALRPLLEKLDAEARRTNAETIFALPPNGPRDFHRLFDALKIEGSDSTFRDLGVTFHSTRVTVATRLAQGDYSKSKAMRLLNHSSELIHSTYQRLQAADVADAFSILQIPANPSGSQSSESSGDPSAN
jgi:site-specific recombinase XerD